MSEGGKVNEGADRAGRPCPARHRPEHDGLWVLTLEHHCFESVTSPPSLSSLLVGKYKIRQRVLGRKYRQDVKYRVAPHLKNKEKTKKL